jgi:hypothetical protein
MPPLPPPLPQHTHPLPWSAHEPAHGRWVWVLDGTGALVAEFPARTRQLPARYAVSLIRHEYDLTAARAAARLLVAAANRQGEIGRPAPPTPVAFDPLGQVLAHWDD